MAVLDETLRRKYGDTQVVWVFVAPRAAFPSGVFSNLDLAEEWIKTHALSGTLTAYTVDIGVYDWATSRGIFRPKRLDQRSPTFIGRFSDASQEHYHYVRGRRAA